MVDLIGIVKRLDFRRRSTRDYAADSGRAKPKGSGEAARSAVLQAARNAIPQPARGRGEATRPQNRDYLAVHGVEKSFANRKVVHDVSLYVRRGEAVGLLGPNGAGKTTVFYMITGLIKADRGRIHLDGYDVTSLPMYQRARLGIGYLPQEGLDLSWPQCGG